MELQEEIPKSKKIRSITVNLSEPVEWGSETIEKLVLRRPKAKDIEHISSNPTMKELLSVAQKCARVPKRVIDELDGEDAMSVTDAIADFLDGGQQTGNIRSF